LSILAGAQNGLLDLVAREAVAQCCLDVKLEFVRPVQRADHADVHKLRSRRDSPSRDQIAPQQYSVESS
jgi:hypothetical protein